MKQSNLREVLDKLQDLREELDKLVAIKGPNDLKALELSQKLDKVLNEYYKLLKDPE